MNSVRVMVLGAVMAVAAAGAASAQTTPEKKHDNLRRDIAADKRDVKRDTRGIAADKRDVKQDVNAGKFGEAQRDLRDLKKDQADRRNDQRDITKDKRDVRKDRRQLRDSTWR